MVKPNTEFRLTVKDIDLIEKALYNMISYYGNRGNNEGIKQVTALLGKIHNQKNFYRPDDDSYVSG